MRVIAGQYKGRRLAAPTWTGLRPTSDRLKQTLFDVLCGTVPGANVLDGFAGSGALGIEALSRGAASATFIDDDRRAIELVERNLEHCGIADGYVMIRDSFLGAIRRLAAGRPFDLIVLDPPYDCADLTGTLSAAVPCLAPGGTLVLEHARRSDVPDWVASVTLIRALRAGDSALAFYRATVDSARTALEET
jgi:16S rRNA (guanine966-N2)-methyltransferase